MSNKMFVSKHYMGVLNLAGLAHLRAFNENLGAFNENFSLLPPSWFSIVIRSHDTQVSDCKGVPLQLSH
jgi:hypothetical protein